MLLQVIALAAAVLLVVTYLKVRVPQLTVLDSFMFCFLVQYGPQALFPNPFNVFAPEVGERVEAQFLIGMTLAYAALACGFLVAAAMSRPPDSVTAEPGPRPTNAVLPLVVAAVYVAFFALVQGDGLHITREYLAGFFGRSSFTYTEIRREVFGESLYVRLASVPRFTITALLFAWLLLLVRPLRPASPVLALAAVAVFVVCGMQMNKFPFVYFLVLAGLVLAVGGGFRLDRRQARVALAGALVVALPVMYGLYQVQYRDAATLDGQRLFELLIYRVFFCASDTLRLWFDYFPQQEGFLGLRGMGSLATLLGVPEVNATEIIPESYVRHINTTMQTGFIGSGFAMGGLLGVVAYAGFVGLFVGLLSRLQWADRKRLDLAPFWCVLLLNMFFFTTRELHTAMLSGGTVSVLVLLLVWRSWSPGSRRVEPQGVAVS